MRRIFCIQSDVTREEFQSKSDLISVQARFHASWPHAGPSHELVPCYWLAYPTEGNMDEVVYGDQVHKFEVVRNGYTPPTEQVLTVDG